MKKVTFAAFVAFWSSVVTTLALARMNPPEQPTAGQPAKPVYTLEEVARHSSEASCWLVIEGKVYDVTGYVPRHPAPKAVILRWCGKEATEGMRTKGYGADHTPAAWGMLDEYLIGEYSPGS